LSQNAGEFNEEQKRRAAELEAVASHDDLPLGREGTEGNVLGAEAKPSRADLGDLDPAHPAHGANVSEYQPPPSKLPTSANPLEGYKSVQGLED
jgi:hypothetical protein